MMKKNSSYLACCGADKRVDSANNLSVTRASVAGQRQWRETEGKSIDTTKVTILLPELQTCM